MQQYVFLMQRTFFIGDIHGCSKTFKKMVKDNIGVTKGDIICCLGDYVDRGPDSKGVVDFILELKEGGCKVYTLRGNHEQMLLDSEEGGFYYELWMQNGGHQTLDSFDINSVAELSPVYKEFFRDTEFFFQTDDYITVHAGLNFNAGNPLEDWEAMLWIRDFWVDESYLKNKPLIHAHTPISRDMLIQQGLDGAVNLDGGCVYKYAPGLGSLFALDFYGKKFHETRNIDF